MTEIDKKPNISSPEIEIGRNTQEIKNFLEMLAINGLGKPVYVTKQKKDYIPANPLIKNPSQRELIAVALPLSYEEISSWLIITCDGNFIKVEPPSREDYDTLFKKRVINSKIIEFDNKEYRDDNIDFTDLFWFASISYDTATTYQSHEIKKQIEQDFKTALGVAKEKRIARLQAQIDRQQMILKEMREFFNPPPEEKND